jgi:hypothetical protein
VNHHQPLRSREALLDPRRARAGIRTRRDPDASPVIVPPVVREVLNSPGQPLDMATRSFMEPRFKHDFSQVRVHTDDRAGESARAVNALAYTAGRDIVFAAGGYRPEYDEGKRLLAHELAHVVQQGQREGVAVSCVSRASSAPEAESFQAAAAVLSGRSAKATPGMTGVALARQPAAPEKDDTSVSLPPPKETTVAEREREVESVVVGDQTYVLYQKEVRTGGSSSWLANNPGNMDYSLDLVDWGAYEGKKLAWGKHRFAIFPDEPTGRRAVQNFLRKHQGMRDLTLMMNLFAPAGDLGNDPTRYSKAVASALNVPVTTLVKDLSDKQLGVFASTIESVEGWKPGSTYARGDPSLPKEIRDR